MELFTVMSNSVNPKKYAKQMNEMKSTIEEICAEVNKFIKIAVDDKTIDLQEIS